MFFLLFFLPSIQLQVGLQPCVKISWRIMRIQLSFTIWSHAVKACDNFSQKLAGLSKPNLFNFWPPCQEIDILYHSVSQNGHFMNRLQVRSLPWSYNPVFSAQAILNRSRPHVSISDISQRREIACWNVGITLKFHRRPGSTAAEVPVKFQSDRTILNTNLPGRDFARSYDKTSCRILKQGPETNLALTTKTLLHKAWFLCSAARHCLAAPLPLDLLHRVLFASDSNVVANGLIFKDTQNIYS